MKYTIRVNPRDRQASPRLEAAARLLAVRKSTLSTIFLSLMLVAFTFQSQSTFAQSQSSNSVWPTTYSSRIIADDSFRRKFYGGLGIGSSWVEPDTSRVPGVDVNNRVNAGGQVTLGMDVSKWFSLEAHAATLGDAGLSPSGSIGYETMGLSGLAYVGKNRHQYNRHGFSGFGRIGVGVLKNEPSTGLVYSQVNSEHVLVGAGVEYATRMGIGIRAEAISFDTDVRYGQLGLLYRFGKQGRRIRKMETVAPETPTTPKPAPNPASKLIITPVPAVAVVMADNDYDGVIDSADQCPNTRSNVAVDGVGCAIFSGVIEGVNFNSGSADLTQNAQSILGGVVSTLNRYPNVKLTIMAHTDSQGDSNANKQLSKRRAKSVAVFLVNNGIRVSRLRALGYGESRPIDTNDTSNGRLRNRRVEFLSQQ